MDARGRIEPLGVVARGLACADGLRAGDSHPVGPFSVCGLGFPTKLVENVLKRRLLHVATTHQAVIHDAREADAQKTLFLAILAPLVI
jgi:hypothetical protein